MRLGSNCFEIPKEEIRTPNACISLWHDNTTGMDVRVKKFFEKSSYLYEKNAYNLVNKFDVIHMIGCDDEENYIIMEDGKEDLNDYINRTYKEGFYDTEEDIIKRFKPFLYNLRDLHRENIVHGDIKPENISTRNNVYTLFDFGYCEKLDPCSKSVKKVGTDYYLAPELINGYKHDSKIDVYSTGITLFAAATKTFPFDSGSYEDYIWDQFKKNIDIGQLYYRNMSDQFIGLIEDMLEPNQKYRCTIDDCINVLF